METAWILRSARRVINTAGLVLDALGVNIVTEWFLGGDELVH